MLKLCRSCEPAQRRHETLLLSVTEHMLSLCMHAQKLRQLQAGVVSRLNS